MAIPLQSFSYPFPGNIGAITVTLQISLHYSTHKVFKSHVKSSLENPRVEAASNTSTVTMRVVGGDEKGSLESETIKYGHESYGTLTRK
jgi:hypothetical protein